MTSPTIPERLATLEADMATVKGDTKTIKADVKTLLLANAGSTGSAVLLARMIPWIALAVSAFAVVTR